MKRAVCLVWLTVAAWLPAAAGAGTFLDLCNDRSPRGGAELTRCLKQQSAALDKIQRFMKQHDLSRKIDEQRTGDPYVRIVATCHLRSRLKRLDTNDLVVFVRCMEKQEKKLKADR